MYSVRAGVLLCHSLSKGFECARQLSTCASVCEGWGTGGGGFKGTKAGGGFCRNNAKQRKQNRGRGVRSDVRVRETQRGQTSLGETKTRRRVSLGVLGTLVWEGGDGVRVRVRKRTRTCRGGGGACDQKKGGKVVTLSPSSTSQESDKKGAKKAFMRWER